MQDKNSINSSEGSIEEITKTIREEGSKLELVRREKFRVEIEGEMQQRIREWNVEEMSSGGLDVFTTNS